ncbi:MAG: hypothetical protein NZ845_01765 [Thermodesulfovibrio sp.]|nr:hypothetical protein [Thermodesulfovibrio sp.]
MKITKEIKLKVSKGIIYVKMPIFLKNWGKKWTGIQKIGILIPNIRVINAKSSNINLTCPS